MMVNENNMQNKFAFFANFAETIRETLPEEQQAAAYKAICEYGIYGELPDDPMLKAMCLMAKSSIFNKGGAPEGNKNASKKQPQNNLKTTKNNPKTTPLETETEIETEKETETEAEAETEKSCFSENNSKQYAFEGKIIRLKQKDFDSWQLAYPNLNLRAELMQRDLWLQGQTEAERKNWFISTGQFFIKQNERRKIQHKSLVENTNDNEADYSWV